MLRLVARGVALVLLAVSLAGCGDDDEQPAPVTSPATAVAPSPTPPRCPPGSHPDTPGPVARPRPTNNGAEVTMALDRERARLLLLDWPDGLHGGVRTWAFDLCTNTWEALRPDREPVVGRRARLVFDEGRGRAVAFPLDAPTAPWVFDPAANRWSPRPVAPSAPAHGVPVGDVAYDPTAGDIVVHDSWTSDLWAYEVGSNTWAELRQDGPSPREQDDHSLLTYDRAARRFVLAVIGIETWAYDRATRRWTTGSASPGFNTGYFETGSEVTYDESRHRVVAFSDGLLAEYETATDEWEVRYGSVEATTGALSRLSHAIVYDPVNERVVLCGGRVRAEEGWVQGRGLARTVLAFDPSRGTWLELLGEAPA